MRRYLPVALVASSPWPAQAPAQRRRADRDRRPAHPVSALDGRIVWSDYDPAAKRYFLTQRLNGVTSRLPVDPRSVPFDLDLGPDADGKPVAAYSRCRREPPPRNPPRGAIAQLPEWRLGRGCDLYLYSFEQGREVLVRFASSHGASEFLPTVWTDRIAFARVYERRRGRAGRRAFLYVRPNSLFTSQGRRGHTRRLPGGPRTGPGPTALDLATRRLAFGWDSTDPRPLSAVYLDVMRNTGRTAKRRLDRGHSGELQGREFIAPQFDEQVRVVWLASFEGDKTEARRAPLLLHGREQEEARIPPLPTDLILRTEHRRCRGRRGLPLPGLGFRGYRRRAVHHTRRRASPIPGCSELQPCELRRAQCSSSTALRRCRPRQRQPPASCFGALIVTRSLLSDSTRKSWMWSPCRPPGSCRTQRSRTAAA